MQISQSDMQHAQISKFKKKAKITIIAHRKFKPLAIPRIVKDYHNTKNRLILLDNDGTLVKSN